MLQIIQLIDRRWKLDFNRAPIKARPTSETFHLRSENSEIIVGFPRYGTIVETNEAVFVGNGFGMSAPLELLNDVTVDDRGQPYDCIGNPFSFGFEADRAFRYDPDFRIVFNGENEDAYDRYVANQQLIPPEEVSEEKDDDGGNGGTVAAVVIVVLIVLIGGAVVAVLWIKRRESGITAANERSGVF